MDTPDLASELATSVGRAVADRNVAPAHTVRARAVARGAQGRGNRRATSSPARGGPAEGNLLPQFCGLCNTGSAAGHHAPDVQQR